MTAGRKPASLPMMAVARELLEMLRCPETREKLIHFEPEEDDGEEFLFCYASRLKYRVDDGIPVMLVEEAERLDQSSAEELLARAKERGLAGADEVG